MEITQNVAVVLDQPKPKSGCSETTDYTDGTDAVNGEDVHLPGEASLLGIMLQIRVHLCSSVVELFFLG